MIGYETIYLRQERIEKHTKLKKEHPKKYKEFKERIRDFIWQELDNIQI